MSKKIKVAGYSKKTTYNGNISYRPFSQDLVGVQLASNGGTPLFTMGNFSITTNLDPKINKNYINGKFSDFITLENLDLNVVESQILLQNNTNTFLNLDPRNLKNYSLFGSMTEYIRIVLEDIITKLSSYCTVYTVHPGPSCQSFREKYSASKHLLLEDCQVAVIHCRATVPNIKKRKYYYMIFRIFVQLCSLMYLCPLFTMILNFNGVRHLSI